MMSPAWHSELKKAQYRKKPMSTQAGYFLVIVTAVDPVTGGKIPKK